MPADRTIRGAPIRYLSAPELEYNDESDSDVYEVHTSNRVFPVRKRRCYRANDESDMEDTGSHMRNDSPSDYEFQTEDDESHMPEF